MATTYHQRDRARAALSDRVGAENLSRDALRDIDRSQLHSRPGDVERFQQPPNQPANVDRGQFQNRDNALRGADSGMQARQQIDRGTASQAAAQRRAQP